MGVGEGNPRGSAKEENGMDKGPKARKCARTVQRRTGRLASKWDITDAPPAAGVPQIPPEKITTYVY